MPHPLLARRRAGPLFARDRAMFDVVPRRPARLPARADAVAGAERQLLQALRRGLVRADHGRCVGAGQPHVLAAGRRARSRAAVREPSRWIGSEPVPGAERDHRGRAARRRAGPRARARLRGQRLSRRRQAAAAGHAARGPGAVRGQRRLRGRPSATEVVEHYVNAADVELAAFDSAVTDWERFRGLRAACEHGRHCAPAGGDAGVGRLARHRVRPGAVADRLRGDRRAPRDGDQARACCRPERACRPSASCAPSSGSPARRCARRCWRSAQSGHLYATRGRGGGTFVADPQPPAGPPSPEVLAAWREVCDQRMAVEVGIAVLAAERAAPESARACSSELVGRARRACSRTSPPTARPTSASTSRWPRRPGAPRLVAAMTEMQGAMTRTDLADRPPAGGARLLQRAAPPRAGGSLRRHDGAARGPGDGRAPARHRARARRAAAEWSPSQGVNRRP